MGLDITAYRKLKVVENPIFDEDGDLFNWDSEWKPGASMDWSERHFPGRAEGIDSKTVYEYEDSYDFRAGSYSGYGVWRSELKRFNGNIAFQELINFADNEGVIGYVVAKKLAKDFSDHEAEAKEFAKTLGDNGEWWLAKYYDWKKAFEMASDNGAVGFH